MLNPVFEEAGRKIKEEFPVCGSSNVSILKSFILMIINYYYYNNYYSVALHNKQKQWQ